MTRKCVVCDGSFEPSHGNQTLCSLECRLKRAVEYVTNHKARNRVEPGPKRCIVCGDSFQTAHGLEKICSAICRRKRNIEYLSIQIQNAKSLEGNEYQLMKYYNLRSWLFYTLATYALSQRRFDEYHDFCGRSDRDSDKAQRYWLEVRKWIGTDSEEQQYDRNL